MIDLVARAEWGAASPLGRFSRMAAPEGLIFHHSAGTGRTVEAVAGIQQLHQQDRRWSDIAYNFLIAIDGSIIEGRPEVSGSPAIGAHSKGHNHARLGACLLGDFREGRDRPSAEQIAAAVDLCQWSAVRYGISPMKISAHRDHRATECPGDRLYRLVPTIRELAGRPFQTRIQVA